MSKIPIVKKGIRYSLSKDIESSKKEKESGNYLVSFWLQFKKEQPALAKIVAKEIETFKTAKETAAFAHGVWIVYATLKSQEEADEMNKDWG